jgi:hypothetical protein
MDIYGRKPSTPDGRYFRATIGEWNPIYQLTAKLCSGLLDPQTFEGMAFNSGAGPKNQRTCTEMADRFEVWMQKNPKSAYRVKRGLPALMILRFGFVSLSGSPYRVERFLLREWVKFLRHCGGFEVW